MASVAAGCDQCNGQPAGTFVPADRHQSSTSQVHLRLRLRCGVRTYLPTETGQPRQRPEGLAPPQPRKSDVGATLVAMTDTVQRPGPGADDDPGVDPSGRLAAY